MSRDTKVRLYLTVTHTSQKSGRRSSWRYAVDVKERRIDGHPIALVDYLPDDGRRPMYVGRFDPTATEEASAILLSDHSRFPADAIEYRAAAWSLLRIYWANAGDLPAGATVSIEPAPGYSAEQVAELSAGMHAAAE